MKSRLLILLSVFLVLGGCGIYKSIFSIVYNKFPETKEPYTSTFEDWNNSNLFILRVELEEKSKIEYEKNNAVVTELSDYPVKDYKLLTHPDPNNQNVVEEVYLYLSNFDNGSQHGEALYMSSMPLMPKVSQLIFCNANFISTYGINHLMSGKWKRVNGEVKLELADKDNGLKLEGIFINDSDVKFLEFRKATHPKQLSKDKISLIEIKEVFEVNPNGENSEDLPIQGIRFFQNTTRTFVHPDWGELGKKFDYERNKAYYLENLEKRKISKVMIGGSNGKNIYFQINNGMSGGSQTKTFIEYRK